MYGAGDVRVESLPDAVLQASTDAVVRVVRACICGSDLHPYRGMPASEQGSPMGHEYVGVVEETGSEVTGLTPATSSSRRSRTPTTPASSAARVCTPPAGSAASGRPAASAAGRPRPSAYRWPTAPS